MPTVRLADSTLSYVEAGQGQPLVLVHGFPLDHSMWRYQIAELSKTLRVIAVDLPGFGQSTAPNEPMSIIGFADRLAEFCDRLGMTEKFILGGLSMGGSISLQFALRHGHRLSHLILCDCRAAVDSPDTRKTRLELADRVLREGPEFVAQAMPGRLFSPESLERQPETVAAIQAVIRTTSRESVAGGSRALAEREDVVARLPEIAMPTLIVVGREDIISTVQEMRQMALSIPQAMLVEIPRAGHMAPLEAPAIVNAEIIQWLSNVNKSH